jgi:DNA-binding FadR family transcriptional regulator
VRASLERDAAAEAAVHRTQADVAAIQEAAAARRDACGGANRARFVEADVAFHRAVIAATGNPVLVDLYAGLTEALQRSVTEVDEYDEDPETFPGHDELAAAIAAGDPDAARAAADSYLDAARAIVERTR